MGFEDKSTLDEGIAQGDCPTPNLGSHTGRDVQKIYQRNIKGSTSATKEAAYGGPIVSSDTKAVV
jgi:hypothetical protein